TAMGIDRLSPLEARLKAEALAQMPGSASLLGAAELFKRVKNITKDVEFPEFDRQILTESAEIVLIRSLDEIEPRFRDAIAKRDSAKAGKFVYLFGKKTDGNGRMKPLLGGKGANLAEMCRIGLPVPPGFTITTEVCTYYYAHKRTYPSALRAQMQAGVAALEKQTGKTFGDLVNPLLVSVRSGARDSMPGMMDTIL